MNNIYDELKIVEKSDDIYEEILNRLAFKVIELEYNESIPLDKMNQLTDAKNRIENIYTFPSNGGLKKFLDYYWNSIDKNYEEKFYMIEYNEKIYIIIPTEIKSFAFEDLFDFDDRINKFQIAKVRYKKTVEVEVELSNENVMIAKDKDPYLKYVDNLHLNYINDNFPKEDLKVINEEVDEYFQEIELSYIIDSEEDFEDFKNALKNEE